MEENSLLQLELHKLSGVKSEETVDNILSTLWKSRKTGLRGPDKSQLQSLLHLSSLSQLDPVLACLRLLIRKCAYQNLTVDELLKLFPPDLPLDLQSILLSSFQKNQDRWKEEILGEQDLPPRTSVSYQVRTIVPPSLPSSEMQMPQSLWPRQDDSLCRINHNDIGISTPLVADVNVSDLPACFQCDIAPAENLANLPCLKSLTWTMENCGPSPADRVAIINLKLHDNSKSTLGDTEVKFQLTKDTLEAMLRSMTYISEQLSAVRTCPVPANKKHKQ